MSALELLSAVTHAIYVVIFIVVGLRTLRHRTPAHLDMTIFFGTAVIVIAASRLAPVVGSPAWLSIVLLSALMALPYALLRLVRDFTPVRRSIMLSVEIALLVSIAAILVTAGAPPSLLIFVMLTLVAGLTVYCSIAFVRAARRAQGVTRRRLESVSAGSVFIGIALLMAGTEVFLLPPYTAVANALVQLFALASGVAYYFGFAPPAVIKRAWQTPEVDAFLSRAAELPQLPSTSEVLDELERTAAAATGASATIGLWDEERGTLRFQRRATPDTIDVRPGDLAGGRAFAAQVVQFSADPMRDHPEGVETYRASGVGATIAAPITRSGRRIGVLCIFAPRPPFFAVSDMELVQLLADQAAAILEARELTARAASIHAREQAARLKEDFLSAAAHDLKTPLTTVVAQAQLLERRAKHDPSAPPDIPGIERVSREAQRLAVLVTELLDAGRLEKQRLVGDRETVDLGELAREVAQCHDNDEHRIQVKVREPVAGSFDRRRLEQLMDNLLENAAKYSEDSQPIGVDVWREDQFGRIAVSDRGIGIPAADLGSIFERFTRGSNVDDRRYHGMGLGLYICRAIAEEHGGRIWVETQLGQGTTFHVELPLLAERRMN